MMGPLWSLLHSSTPLEILRQIVSNILSAPGLVMNILLLLAVHNCEVFAKILGMLITSDNKVICESWECETDTKKSRDTVSDFYPY